MLVALYVLTALPSVTPYSVGSLWTDSLSAKMAASACRDSTVRGESMRSEAHTLAYGMLMVAVFRGVARRLHESGLALGNRT